MTANSFASEDILKKATEVLDIEIEGLQTIRKNLGQPFVDCVKRCFDTVSRGGKLVVTGIGKSGHIGQKMAATLASTGSRAVFMHPVEAMHGDLGVVSPQDTLLALSYSGETDELLAVIPAIKRLGIDIIAITQKADSRLGECAELVVPMPVPREACPFNLAPTTTTTALTALGDALAMTMLYLRHFQLNDYAKLHPAGAIGRSITLKVKDFMRTGDHAANVRPGTSVRDALLAMTAARCGAVAIVDDNNNLLGIFTDGDFRRRITTDTSVIDAAIETVMTQNPITINENSMAVEIMKLLEKRKIDDILVTTDDGKFAGLVDIQDLPKFKVM
ncbi:MAG: KpsF/GutQ family sugar-phosphate isomerase [Lentisphaeria bacterium]|nr:KpsF/GutQ family sugar-phosphate isomerase [Victivallales bacterium]MBR6057877.1 KpsF/GutQ family sugar-phosphate isomerase [Victivallales bacterium]MCR4573568.1 KpsF/GutQ family sugar-phosphate isomerase [Lentisphaeria bacterium]